MDWQQAAALGIVAATAGAFVLGRLRRRRFDFGRDTHCGCSSPSSGPASKSSVIFRARRGERPEIIIKNG